MVKYEQGLTLPPSDVYFYLLSNLFILSLPKLLRIDYGHQKIANLSPKNKTAYNKTTPYSGTSGLGKLLSHCAGFGFTQLMLSLICTLHLFLQIIQGSEYLQHTFFLPFSPPQFCEVCWTESESLITKY